MSEEKERSSPLSNVKKKKKYLYLERFETYALITESRLRQIEFQNIVHWSIHALLLALIIWVTFK